MTIYPSGIDNSTSLPPVVDNVTAINAAVYNNLRNAIIAIEAELGVDPSREYATVRARLDALTAMVEAMSGGLSSLGQIGISSNDTTFGWASDKITVGDGLQTTIVNPGGNEELLIELTDVDEYAWKAGDLADWGPPYAPVPDPEMTAVVGLMGSELVGVQGLNNVYGVGAPNLRGSGFVVDWDNTDINYIIGKTLPFVDSATLGAASVGLYDATDSANGLNYVLEPATSIGSIILTADKENGLGTTDTTVDFRLWFTGKDPRVGQSDGARVTFTDFVNTDPSVPAGSGYIWGLNGYTDAGVSYFNTKNAFESMELVWAYNADLDERRWIVANRYRPWEHVAADTPTTTVTVGKGIVRADSSTGTKVVNLPENADGDDWIIVKDTGGFAETNNISIRTIDGSTIDGVSGVVGVDLNVDNGAYGLRYNDRTTNWELLFGNGVGSGGSGNDCGVPVIYSVTATEGQTDFTLPSSPSLNIVLMVVSGITQNPADYVVNDVNIKYSGLHIPAGETVTFYYYRGGCGFGDGIGGPPDVYSTIASADQKDFTLPDIPLRNIVLMAVNGILQFYTDFTISGTTVTYSGIPLLSGAQVAFYYWTEEGVGTDPLAIHVNVASEIEGIDEKTSPVDTDIVVIEDSEDGYNKKRVQIGNLPGSGVDELVKISATDTTASYLEDKILDGYGISTEITDPGGNEQLTINSLGMVRVTAADVTYDYLLDKLSSGYGIAITELDIGGGNLTSRIAAIYVSQNYNVLAGSNDNFVIGQNVNVCRLIPAGIAEITGFDPSLQWDDLFIKIFCNVGSFNITLRHNNTGSAPGYRMLIMGGVDIVLRPNDFVLSFYDQTTGYWRISGLGGSGSGGEIAISDTLSAGDNNDVAPTNWDVASVLRLDSPAAAGVTGFSAAISGDVLTKKIYNIGSFNITIRNENVGSVVANRIIVPGGSDLIMEPNDVVDVFYDITSLRWRIG